MRRPFINGPRFRQGSHSFASPVSAQAVKGGNFHTIDSSHRGLFDAFIGAPGNKGAHQLDQLDDDIQDMAHNRNHIRMAMPLQLGTQFLPLILGDFRWLHPEIRIDVIESGGISALQMVEDEKLDIALTNYESGFSTKLNYQKLFTCECCFVTYPGHPLAGRKTVSLEDFAEEPLVMLDSSFFVYRMVHEMFLKAGREGKILHYSPYLHTIKNLVKNGIVSTFLTRQAVLPEDHLAVIPLAEPFFINSGIVTKKGRQIYEDEKILMAYLQDITKYLK